MGFYRHTVWADHLCWQVHEWSRGNTGSVCFRKMEAACRRSCSMRSSSFPADIWQEWRHEKWWRLSAFTTCVSGKPSSTSHGERAQICARFLIHFFFFYLFVHNCLQLKRKELQDYITDCSEEEIISSNWLRTFGLVCCILCDIGAWTLLQELFQVSECIMQFVSPLTPVSGVFLFPSVSHLVSPVCVFCLQGAWPLASLSLPAALESPHPSDQRTCVLLPLQLHLASTV